MYILSIDIGFSTLTFILTKVFADATVKTYIIVGSHIKKIEDIKKYLLFLLNHKTISLVLIEKQFNSYKNVGLMRFIEGFMAGLQIRTLIKNPIAFFMEGKNPKRNVKKQFSQNLIAKLFNKNGIFIEKNILTSDVCDALNICYKYVSEIFNINDYVKKPSLQIKKISYIYLD